VIGITRSELLKPSTKPWGCFILFYTSRVVCQGQLTMGPKYSEAVIWGNSRCFSIQETLPKASLFGKDRSGKERQSQGLC
jgi:hypothetical protein